MAVRRANTSEARRRGPATTMAIMTIAPPVPCIAITARAWLLLPMMVSTHRHGLRRLAHAVSAPASVIAARRKPHQRSFLSQCTCNAGPCCGCRFTELARGPASEVLAQWTDVEGKSHADAEIPRCPMRQPYAGPLRRPIARRWRNQAFRLSVVFASLRRRSTHCSYVSSGGLSINSTSSALVS